MSGTIPPALLGPRMAVRAYFPFDNRTVAPGTRADWAWAMAQWDRVAAAGHAVRLVVADQTYSRFDTGVPAEEARRSDVRGRITACRDQQQLVFGRVYAAGGKLPLGTVGQKFDDPLKPGHQVPGMAGQIDAWRRLYGDRIDGIYVDSGPTDCTSPDVAGSELGIPANYRGYVDAIRRHGYAAFLQAAQYPDAQGWVRALGADLLELWESGVAPYSTKYLATDACRPDRPGVLPDWWADPGLPQRWRRVHVVDDCRDAETMRKMAQLAVGERGAWTVLVTRPRQDPMLGAVFDTLPAYWDDEVAFFARFAAAEEKEAKDGKDTKDGDDQTKSGKDSKDQKDDKDDKENKDGKDGKDDKDAAEQAAKDDKDSKDGKDIPDNKAKEEPKDKNEDKEEKEDKDGKDRKDDDDKMPEFLKDSERFVKALEAVGDAGVPGPDDLGAEPPAPEPVGRTFIRPWERPAVGERIVADPPAPGPGETEG